MLRDEHGRFLKRAEAEAAVQLKKAQVLAVEAHPVLGRTVRWQLSDGSVLVETVKVGA